MSSYYGVNESGPHLYSSNSYKMLMFSQVIINENNAHDTKDAIERRLTAVKSQRSSGELEDLALVIGTVYPWWHIEDD